MSAIPGKESDRTNAQGSTSSSSPQVGLRLVPTDWLSLMANYAFTSPDRELIF